MAESGERKRGGFVPIARLKPPSGGPSRLYARARLARVRELLGPTLGPQLVEMTEGGDRIELAFAGRGWEQALAAERETLARKIARRLGRAHVVLVVRSRPEAAPVARARAGAAATREDEAEPLERVEMLERLARLGARFAERGRGRRGER